MKKKAPLSYAGNPKHKASLVADNGGYETTGERPVKKGTEKPAKKPKFSKPQTVKMSKDERRAGYMKHKGLKILP